MATEIGLGGLQRWLQAVIVHPGTVEEALATSEATAVVPAEHVEHAVRPSATLTASERLAVYQDMYSIRMSEALEADYPALAHFLGRERWEGLVRDYLEAHPSTSYTLNVLGRALPEWLRGAEGLPRRGFCLDLARLEWAMTEAFDAADTPPLGETALASVAPGDWPGVRLVPGASVRLLELRWNVGAWLDSTKDERHDHPRPRRHDAWVVVHRRGYAVGRREMPRPAFRLLQALVSGLTVGEALSEARRRRQAPLPEALTGWFRDWASAGLFSGLERPGEPPRGR